MWIRITVWGHVAQDFGLWSCGLGLWAVVVWIRIAGCGHVD